MMHARAILPKGFTLIEAVIVIAITGIVVAMVAVFIRVPVESYFASVDRAELTDVADTALRRMARDIRLALPNSIRVATDGAGNTYLEFLLTNTGGRYLDEDDGEPGNILDFHDTTQLQFTVVGPSPQVAIGNHIVVYNLGPGFAPADAYAGGNRAAVTDVTGNTITLANNPFAAQSPSMRSPSRRFQVVTTPVTYGCVGNSLIRYSGYGITAAQATPLGGQNALLATDVANCAFSYNSDANVRSALVGLSLQLASNGETVRLFHQVHVDNTP